MGSLLNSRIKETTYFSLRKDFALVWGERKSPKKKGEKKKGGERDLGVKLGGRVR